MSSFHHSFGEDVTNELSETIDAAYISFSKLKCRAVGSYLRKYIKSEKGMNGGTSRYLRTRAGFDLKVNSQVNEEDQAGDSEKEKVRSTDEITENSYLCVQLWTLYERMENFEFFQYTDDAK